MHLRFRGYLTYIVIILICDPVTIRAPGASNVALRSSTRTSLKEELISPNVALEWAEEVAPGCVGIIPTTVYLAGVTESRRGRQGRQGPLLARTVKPP